MYNLIKGELERKKFDLTDITKKINVLWVQGILTDEQKEELLTMAQGNANIEANVNVIKWLTELEGRVRALEQASASGGSDDEEIEEPTEESYPEFVVGKHYYAGDKITFNGKDWECVAPVNFPCTWSPTEYPPYWKEVTE